MKIEPIYSTTKLKSAARYDNLEFNKIIWGTCTGKRYFVFKYDGAGVEDYIKL